MITCKPSDYLTVTLKPDRVECTIDELVNKMLEAFLLTDLVDKFQYVASNFMYEQILRFSDISLKIPYEYKYTKQGVCLEMSGQGVSYYIEYLSTHYNKADLRFVGRRFFGLAKLGYRSQCSRFDVAFDEKHSKGDTSETLLDLDEISGKLLNGEFVSKFRKSDPELKSGEAVSCVFTVDPRTVDEKLPYRFIKSMNFSSGRVGKTVELGKRKSSSFARFYDKLAEQEAHNFEVPENLTSWTRFEIEFKHNTASCVFSDYASSKSDDEFADRVRTRAYNLIRFIDLDHSRKYNCSCSDWWFEFLNKAKGAKFVYDKPKYNKYVRSLESKKRQQAASLAALIMCDRRNVVSLFTYGMRHLTPPAMAILSDFDAIRDLDPEEYANVYKRSIKPETGVEFWKNRTLSGSDEEFEAFLDSCSKQLQQDLDKILDGEDL